MCFLGLLLTTKLLCRVDEILQHLRLVNPETPILLLSLLPMTEEEEPNASNVYPWPNKFTPAVTALNGDLERLATRQQDVHYQDCHQVFLSADGVS